MATKPKITSREKARTKKKVGLAVYFTFIATFALCFGAQLWMIDVFNPKDETPSQTYNTNYNTPAQNSNKPSYSTTQKPQNQPSQTNNESFSESENQDEDVDFSYPNRNNQNYSSSNIDTYN